MNKKTTFKTLRGMLLMSAISVLMLAGCVMPPAAEGAGEDLTEVVAPFYSQGLTVNAETDVAELMGELLADDFQSIGSVETKSKDELTQQVQFFWQLIPDLKWDVQEMLQDGNRVIVRSIASGTPNGNFMGVPTDGSTSFSIMTIDIHTIENGQVVQTYNLEDWPTAMGQLQQPAVEESSMPTESGLGLLEVITVDMADGATMETFLPANQVIEDEYASQQPGYIARETAVSDDGVIRLVVHWNSKADSDNSIAGFGEAPGVEAFMGNFNAESMVIKQYELQSSTESQATFPGTGAVEVITVRLQEGSDPAGFIAANKALEESYISQQPGFIAREIGVNEEGEWTIVLHWESAADSEASIAKFESAPGVEEFMSYLDTETMSITVFEVQK